MIGSGREASGRGLCSRLTQSGSDLRSPQAQLQCLHCAFRRLRGGRCNLSRWTASWCSGGVKLLLSKIPARIDCPRESNSLQIPWT